MSGSLTYQGVSFLFGSGTPYSITGFVRGVAETRDQDRDNVRGDGRRFGLDLKSGPTHELSLLVQGDGRTGPEREAALGPLLGAIERVWDAAPLRSRSNDLAYLRVGERACVGRPRTVAPDDSGRWDGVAEIGVTFEAADALWYGQEEVTVVRFVPPASGGLTFPAEAPFTFDSGPTMRNASVQVGGEVATWPVFEISGPVTNPEVDIIGVGRLIFRTTLAYDQTLRVDTRPWARWVKRDGAALPGALSPTGSRLSDVSLRPGTYQVLLRGYDPTGTAELRVSTWAAYINL